MTEPIGEWTTIDKTTWGPGPWHDEPDKVHWIDPATDLDCLIHRGPMGAWCGYVAVTEGHPWFEKGYSECVIGEEDYCDHTPESQTEVHGGLTFADFCAEGDDPSSGICHVPQPGRPDRVWWFGFDCAHAHDVTPASDARSRALGFEYPRFGGEHYRDRAYVEAEVRRLAGQLDTLRRPA